MLLQQQQGHFDQKKNAAGRKGAEQVCIAPQRAGALTSSSLGFLPRLVSVDFQAYSSAVAFLERTLLQTGFGKLPESHVPLAC